MTEADRLVIKIEHNTTGFGITFTIDGSVVYFSEVTSFTTDQPLGL